MPETLVAMCMCYRKCFNLTHRSAIVYSDYPCMHDKTCTHQNQAASCFTHIMHLCSLHGITCDIGSPVTATLHAGSVACLLRALVRSLPDHLKKVTTLHPTLKSCCVQHPSRLSPWPLSISVHHHSPERLATPDISLKYCWRTARRDFQVSIDSPSAQSLRPNSDRQSC